MSNHGKKSSLSQGVKGRRHYPRLLRFLGLLIVFLMFTVKDALREKFKAANDSLTSAENLYVIQESIAPISEHLLKIEADLNDEKAVRTLSQADLHAQIVSELAIMQEQEADLDATYDEISRLISRFPSPGKEQLEKALAPTKDAIDKFHHSVEEIRKRASLPNSGLGDLILVKETFVALALTDAIVTKTGGDVLDGAREIEERYDRAYQSCTRLSYYIYAAGWLLALYGVWRGVEGIGATTE